MTRYQNALSLRGLTALALLGVAAAGCSAPDSETVGGGTTKPATPPAPDSRATALPGERPGPVAVSARWIDADSGTTVDGSKALTARITNTSSVEQYGKLALIASGLDGRLIEQPVRDFRLAPGASEEVPVVASSFPIQSETSAPFVALEVQTERADGKISRFSSEPLYYLFQDGYRRVTLYNSDDVLAKLGRKSVDERLRIEGRVRQPDGKWLAVGSDRAKADGAKVQQPGFSTTRLVTQTELASRTPVVPTTPPGTDGELQASHTQDNIQVCVTWRVQYQDAGLGEDDLATTAWQDAPARFAHARVYLPANPSAPDAFNGQLDLDGCTPVLALNAGTYTLEYNTMGISADGGAPLFNVVQNGPEGGSSPMNEVSFSSFGSGATQTLTFNPTFNNDAIQAAVIASLILGKHLVGPLYGAGDMGLAPTSYALLTNLDCPAGGGACFTPFGIAIGSTTEQGSLSRWKYVVAHEIGHAAQAFSMGVLNPDFNEQVTNDIDGFCRCDHLVDQSNAAHCLQSRETLGLAQFEGFAHAFATRAFNSWVQQDAVFVYYKAIKLPFFGVVQPPRAISAVADYRWMESICPATSRGVELDWLSFFYRVSAESAPNYTSFAQLYDIYRLACAFEGTPSNCGGQDVAWETLRTSALAYYGGSTSNPRYVRFRDTGVAAGVDN
jgi:hypothetical protein